MSFLRSEIATRVFDAPLIIHEGKLVAALAAVGGRIVDGGVHFDAGITPIDHVAYENGRPSLGRLGDRVGRAFDRVGIDPYDLIGNVAVIGIEGTLVHKGAYVGMSSGRTSYQGLQAQVAKARRDDRVKGVVYEVDSFGGEAAGAFETADMMHQLSKEKPTLAILTDHAFSGGFLLASTARRIIAPPNGGVGSIGALSIHADLSRKLQNEGVTVTVLAAGKRKADGNPFAPLPDEVRGRILGRLENARQIFAESIGRYRGDRFTKQNALDTEAGAYTGTEAAAMGMVDAVGNPNDAFEAFLNAINRKG